MNTHTDRNRRLDQIQFGMWLMNCSACDFVVYTPEKTAVERYVYEPDYVHEFLLPRVQRFYFGKCLPRFVAKERDLLEPNGDFRVGVQTEFFEIKDNQNHNNPNHPSSSTDNTSNTRSNSNSNSTSTDGNEYFTLAQATEREGAHHHQAVL